MTSEESKQRKELLSQMTRLSRLLMQEEKQEEKKQPLPPPQQRPQHHPSIIPLHATPFFNPPIPPFMRDFGTSVHSPLGDNPFGTVLQSAFDVMNNNNDLVRALRESMRDVGHTVHLPSGTRPPPPMKESELEECVTDKDDEVVICNICYEIIDKSYVKTTCCSTAEDSKRMHMKCALHCLRQSDLCPFCKSAKIAFK